MWPVRAPITLAVAALACASAGCGKATEAASTPTTPSTSAAPAPPSAPVPALPRSHGAITLPTPGPTGRAADPAAVTVIRSWSDTLRSGDVAAAAHYFALPSRMINLAANGTAAVIRIRTPAQAVAANATLPCGARYESSDQRGAYVNVRFKLSSRPGPGGGCQGASGVARVNFVIRAGRIVEWIRAPQDPADGGQGGGSTPPGDQPPGGQAPPGGQTPPGGQAPTPAPAV